MPEINFTNTCQLPNTMKSKIHLRLKIGGEAEKEENSINSQMQNKDFNENSYWLSYINVAAISYIYTGYGPFWERCSLWVCA